MTDHNSAISFIIITKQDYFEFYCDSIYEVLDYYVRTHIGFNKRFAISESLWNGLQLNLFSDINELIGFINASCRYNADKIKQIISNSNPVYPRRYTVSFSVSDEDQLASYSAIGSKDTIITNFSADHTGTVELFLIAKHGHGIDLSTLQLTDGTKTVNEKMTVYYIDDNPSIIGSDVETIGAVRIRIQDVTTNLTLSAETSTVALGWLIQCYEGSGLVQGNDEGKLITHYIGNGNSFSFGADRFKLNEGSSIDDLRIEAYCNGVRVNDIEILENVENSNKFGINIPKVTGHYFIKIS